MTRRAFAIGSGPGLAKTLAPGAQAVNGTMSPAFVRKPNVAAGNGGGRHYRRKARCRDGREPWWYVMSKVISRADVRWIICSPAIFNLIELSRALDRGD